MADNGNLLTSGEIIHANDIISNYVTSSTFNSTIGDINSILDSINREVV